MKVVYMGTPDFAVPALKALAVEHEVQAVFCQPDRPKGRGKKLQACPVKEAALELDIPVHQPKRVRVRKWQNILKELAPDVIVVAAFGQILSQKILDIPRLGCVNIHASILPRWRGASPIHLAIASGDAETGVAIMKMELELDAGPVYAERRLPITSDTRRLALEADLARIGAEALLETLPNLESITPIQQDEALVTYAPIIGKEFGYVDPLTWTAQRIDRAIRAYEGWPCVYVMFREQPLKIVKAHVIESATDAAPGTLSEVTRKRMILACAEGTQLVLEEVQPPGKKAQPVHAYINGHHPKVGEAMVQKVG